MPEFSIGPEGYIKKIRGSISSLPPEDRKSLEQGKLIIELSEKERDFENWLKKIGEKISFDREHRNALFCVNGVLAGFCKEHDIKVSPPPITYYIPDEQWQRVGELYEDDNMGRIAGGVADEKNRILIRVRKAPQDDPLYNDAHFLNLIDDVNHENLHQLAYRAIQATIGGGKGDNQDDMCLARWGVKVYNPEKDKEYLNDFDEAIIYYFAHKLTGTIVSEHRNLFSGNYMLRSTSSDIVAHLIERLSEKRGGGPEAVKEVEKIFINAEFRGNLLDLGKEISKLYGKGGLRVLAHLVCGRKQNNRDLIMKFIRAKKKETQTHYAFRILPPEEFERYKKLMVEGGKAVESAIDQKKLAA